MYWDQEHSGINVLKSSYVIVFVFFVFFFFNKGIMVFYYLNEHYSVKLVR